MVSSYELEKVVKFLYLYFRCHIRNNILYLLCISGVLLIVVLCTFAFRARLYGWMPMPERNTFGYSFWLEVAANLLLMYTFTASLLAFIFKTLRLSNPKDVKVAEDMMLGRTYSGNDKI